MRVGGASNPSSRALLGEPLPTHRMFIISLFAMYGIGSAFLFHWCGGRYGGGHPREKPCVFPCP